MSRQDERYELKYNQTLKMLSPEEKDYLHSIWTDPKHAGSFAGPEKLYQIVRKEGKYKIGLHRIRQFLSDQDSYALQKRVQTKFKRNRVIDSQWDADLMEKNPKTYRLYNDELCFFRCLAYHQMKSKYIEMKTKELSTVWSIYVKNTPRTGREITLNNLSEVKEMFQNKC